MHAPKCISAYSILLYNSEQLIFTPVRHNSGKFGKLVWSLIWTVMLCLSFYLNCILYRLEEGTDRRRRTEEAPSAECNTAGCGGETLPSRTVTAGRQTRTRRTWRCGWLNNIKMISLLLVMCSLCTMLEKVIMNCMNTADWTDLVGQLCAETENGHIA